MELDKELRLIGFFIKLIDRASLVQLKFLRHLIIILTKGKIVKKLDCSEELIPRNQEDSFIRVRTFRPKGNKEKLPVLLYLHGGGYAIGTPEFGIKSFYSWIKTRDCLVVAPDYRKSLEAPYPAALNDSYDTLLWIKNNAVQLNIKTDQIMVGGHSAGGGLTVATCLYARDKKEVNISFQFPVYPMLDDRMIHPSAINNKSPLWHSQSNKLAWSLYLSALKDKDIPSYAAPSRATDFSNLPPAATFVGGVEPFRDETIEYIENLKREHIPVFFKIYDGCFHGFEQAVPNAKVSKHAKAFINEAFAYAIDNHTAPQIENSESEISLNCSNLKK